MRVAPTTRSTFLFLLPMRAVVQRVLQASVGVLTDTGLVPVSTIGPGLMVLVGVYADDTETDMDYIAKKLLALRLFSSGSATAAAEPDSAASPTSPTSPVGSDGKPWSKNVTDVNGSVLLVSQFTLCHVLKGNKPDFHNAMKGPEARVLFDKMAEVMRGAYLPERIQQGAFGEHMHVGLINDGPVTITLDSRAK